MVTLLNPTKRFSTSSTIALPRLGVALTNHRMHKLIAVAALVALASIGVCGNLVSHATVKLVQRFL